MKPLLTTREKEILDLIIATEGVVGGHKTIAQVIQISPETARTHITNIMRKLDTHKFLQAVLKYQGMKARGEI